MVIDDLRFAVFDLVVNTALGSSLVPRHARRALYRKLGFEVGKATLSPHLRFKTSRARFGDNVFINEGCRFDNAEWVTIGDDVAVGPDAMFVTSSHADAGSLGRAGDVVLSPVRISAGCWIGARAIILPGATVGRGCIVAAGAVVTGDCLPNGLYGGVPATRLRELPPITGRR
jgi:maltose O-acetyltransferase